MYNMYAYMTDLGEEIGRGSAANQPECNSSSAEVSGSGEAVVLLPRSPETGTLLLLCPTGSRALHLLFDSFGMRQLNLNKPPADYSP